MTAEDRLAAIDEKLGAIAERQIRQEEKIDKALEFATRHQAVSESHVERICNVETKARELVHFADAHKVEAFNRSEGMKRLEAAVQTLQEAHAGEQAVRAAYSPWRAMMFSVLSAVVSGFIVAEVVTRFVRR